MKRKMPGMFRAVATGTEEYKAYIPDPLPPKPPIKLDGELQELLDCGLLAIGRLDSVSTFLPETSPLLYMYVRKEAVLSSQIEGTQSSISDLLLYENEMAPGVPLDDVREVSNYVAALEHGLARLRGGLPLSLRLIQEMHNVLLAKGRGSDKAPGEFRRTQNWVGGTRPGTALFVPPPVDQVMRCMGDLEKFLHDDPVRTPLLIKAALTHVQFETIHPFLDGNGRLGRLLITLLLCSEGALGEPLLYLSLYFKTNRERYYDLLQEVRMRGDWEEWLRFFLRGVSETAENAAHTARRLVSLFQTHRKIITDKFGRAAGSALQVHSALQENPVATVPKLAEKTGLSQPAVSAALSRLEERVVVREITGKSYGREYVYSQYLKILNEGAEL